MKLLRKKGCILVAVVCLFALVIAFVFVWYGRVSVDKIPEYLKNREYAKAVKAYNRYASYDEKKKAECENALKESIKDVVIAWESEEMTEKEAVDALEDLEDRGCGHNPGPEMTGGVRCIPMSNGSKRSSC